MFTRPKTRLSQLLELVEGGETVVIARHGVPVAELIRASRQSGFPFGIAEREPLVGRDNDWWLGTQQKAPLFSGASYINRAMTYSPTHLRVQYHRG